MTGLERWLRLQFAAEYARQVQLSLDELTGDLDAFTPTGIIQGAEIEAQRRYGIRMDELKPWTCRGGVWKRW